MARLVIKSFEERVLFPDLPVKHYRVHCSLQTSDGKLHDTYCDMSKDPSSPVFDFTCFDDPEIDEFDFRNKWKMSEKVLNWAKENIHGTVSSVEQDKKSS